MPIHAEKTLAHFIKMFDFRNGKKHYISAKTHWILKHQIITWYPSLRATSIILFLVIPGNIVPLIAGVDITLSY